MTHLETAYKIWTQCSNPGLEYNKYFLTLLDRIRDVDNFTFIRISDGEYHLFKWGISFDDSVDPANMERTKEALNKITECDGSNYLIVAPQWETPNDNGYKYMKYMIDTKFKHLIGTYHASLFSWASVTGGMKGFFEALKNRKVILVGPRYLQDLSIWDSFVETLEDKAWSKQDSLEELIEQELNKYLDPVILYCCSWSGKMAIVKNYFKYGNKITQIDLGANLNPYVDVPIRAWHRPIYEDYRTW